MFSTQLRQWGVSKVRKLQSTPSTNRFAFSKFKNLFPVLLIKQQPSTLPKFSPNKLIVQERIAYQKLLKDFNRMEAATENLQDEVGLFAHC